MEALKKRHTASQLAEKFELHPNQITNWKKEYLEHAVKAFSDKKVNAWRKDREQVIEELYKQIGQIKVEPTG